ncbi:hypothetical protein ACN1T8_002268 [Vibrio cholerae]|uniref:hypothetical protein n=1 Tax=Vibrio cholerae TaxID=666 RepID=UPI001C92E29F|nr:hypothetical protein [Vibrio cholerae]HCH1415161.1 hypothetical protein [Vibrio parahaemolyticus]MBY4643368.1 hypothetical protein [Vibrio cholerae]MCR9658574.1 hypothetical protein [Vibrio cholerae]MCR9689255.1 hypothetical protein [Vibrio cholerae]MCR9738421.1 hypothetical protein [Vibrio cholerae]
MSFNELQKEMEALLKTIPQGVVVEYGIAGNKIDFLIKERPVDFTKQQEKELIEQLNSVVFQSFFVESDISQLKVAPIGESIASISERAEILMKVGRKTNSKPVVQPNKLSYPQPRKSKKMK